MGRNSSGGSRSRGGRTRSNVRPTVGRIVRRTATGAARTSVNLARRVARAAIRANTPRNRRRALALASIAASYAVSQRNTGTPRLTGQTVTLDRNQYRIA